MPVLVAYASRYGATQGIAERIAERLRSAGLQADARRVQDADDIGGYDAFVIGSAVYIEHWLKDATEFMRRNQVALAERPVWLFASGPLGTEQTDPEGHDLRDEARPKEFDEIADAIRPRGMRVFFGALSPEKLGFTHRMIRILPAGRSLLPEGDFRDWQEVEAWADQIAEELKQRPPSERS